MRAAESARRLGQVRMRQVPQGQSLEQLWIALLHVLDEFRNHSLRDNRGIAVRYRYARPARVGDVPCESAIGYDCQRKRAHRREEPPQHGSAHRGPRD